jgi:DNA-directed RNA polymerase subunit RPC12/RpoP
MRQGSLVIPYKCPNCGAAIKITGEMNAERLSQCPYCGGSMAIADIEKFLATIL